MAEGESAALHNKDSEKENGAFFSKRVALITGITGQVGSNSWASLRNQDRMSLDGSYINIDNN